jgi:hypothetical protein
MRFHREVTIGSSPADDFELLRHRAADLAGRLSKSAHGEATLSQERAVLRMLGVDGLDRAGRPLATELVDQFCGAGNARLAGGIVRPFVVALLEYDLAPRELALEVAAGHIDLTLEAELLDRPERRQATERHARGLVASALARFDANRTATHDMRDVLGMPPEPWLGIALRAAEVEAAASEARAVIRDGADLVRVRVPASWEFAEARRAAGLETPHRFQAAGVLSGRDARETHNARQASSGRSDTRAGRDQGWQRRIAGLTAARPSAEDRAGLLEDDPELVPAGSQRGLAALRSAADQAAAERGCYASLMTVTSAFAAPEQAVVAAFERIDLVEADPIREIVEDNVDPERALADHAFAHKLHARAGTRVVMGGGALALGADVASGIPPDAPTRAGRSLALQALGVELALVDGLDASRLLIGAMPGWISGEDDAQAILVQAWLRRLAFPGHRLVLEEPAADPPFTGRGFSLVTAMAGGETSIVVRDHAAGRVSDTAGNLRVAAAAGCALRLSLGDGRLYGDAAELAARTVKAANLTLQRLEQEGWGSLLGPRGESRAAVLGRAAVVERASDSGTAELILASL